MNSKTLTDTSLDLATYQAALLAGDPLTGPRRDAAARPGNKAKKTAPVKKGPATPTSGKPAAKGKR